MKRLKWRKGCPTTRETVLFKTMLGHTLAIGHKGQSNVSHLCMYGDYNGENLCSINDVTHWVPVEEVEALIEE